MITVNRRIEGGDFASAGSATRLLKDRLRMAGVPLEVMRRAMIASYEAEMNVVIHARRGSLWARIDGARLDLEVIDDGPGIPDLDLALREGWSTASEEARRMGFGAGMGLPNIRRSSDRFAIDSEVGRGTRVRSTILLHDRAGGPSPREEPETAAPVPEIRADRCRACRACLSACPTAALRVRDDGLRLLESRCIGCTQCAAACPDRVFGVGVSDELRDPQAAGSALVVPRGFLASFAASPAAVLSALSRLGFAEIRFTEEWDRALVSAALDLAVRRNEPLILPSCPAVTALLQTRFPALLARLAPFVSPLAAAAAGFPLHRLVAVPACPAQRDEVRGESRTGRVAVASPVDLAAAVLPQLAGGSAAGPGSAESPESRSGDGAEAAAAAFGDEPDPRGVLRVSGLRHAVRVLELTEAGALRGVLLLEPFACDRGCIGSPYLGVDPFVAAHRLSEARVAPVRESSAAAAAVSRRQAVAPRTGTRLDADMKTAIAMLASIDEAARRLPGRDCGSCGAPTCAAFAEDLVLGRAGASDCSNRTRPLGGTVR